LFNLVLSGGLLPPPRRCARNEKKDKRSLVEKEIDTGARLIDAHFKGIVIADKTQPPNSQRQLIGALKRRADTRLISFSAKHSVGLALYYTARCKDNQRQLSTF